MKQLFFTICTIIFLQSVKAQLGPVELMTGHNYFHYQHSFAQPLKPDSRLGWQHIATLIKRFNAYPEKGELPDELMNQSYLTFRFHQLLTAKGGLFYTNVGGYQPTIGLQFFWHNKHWVAIASPRIDIIKNGSYELFTSVEFSTSIGKDIELYSRLQAMSNISKESHNRSYQLVRVGVEIKGFQLGGGLTLDEYGTSGKVHYNTGLFLRRMF
ncbi:MAG TPA: hypothetical protein VEY10_10685 [Flavisolibacter sp.]|nr:hypothetical protein [Flavisolibacter sp.]